MHTTSCQTTQLGTMTMCMGIGHNASRHVHPLVAASFPARVLGNTVLGRAKFCVLRSNQGIRVGHGMVEVSFDEAIKQIDLYRISKDYGRC